MSFLGKSKSKIWNCFSEIREANKVKAKCNYCGAIYITHADRMKKHISNKCKSVPQEVRNEYVSTLKIELLV